MAHNVLVKIGWDAWFSGTPSQAAKLIELLCNMQRKANVPGSRSLPGPQLVTDDQRDEIETTQNFKTVTPEEAADLV